MMKTPPVLGWVRLKHKPDHRRPAFSASVLPLKQRFYYVPTPLYESACCLAAASALVARGRPTISE